MLGGGAPVNSLRIVFHVLGEQELLLFSRRQRVRKRWEFLYLDTDYDGFQGEVWGQNTFLVGGRKHKKVNSGSERFAPKISCT